MSRETRLANTHMISNVAIVLIAAVIGFLAFAIDKRELGVPFWVLLGVGIATLVISIILGGRGVAKIETPGSLFDLQAKSCLLGFFLLAGSLFFLGAPTKDDVTARLDKIQIRLGEIAARLDGFDDDLVAVDKRLEEGLDQLPAIRDEISSLRSDSASEVRQDEPESP